LHNHVARLSTAVNAQNGVGLHWEQ